MVNRHLPDKYVYILAVIEGLSIHFCKAYCWPSQWKLKDLAKGWYGYNRSIRSLNRHLASLESLGLITRIRRVRRMPDGALRFQSTIYKLTREGRGVLESLVGMLRKVLRRFVVGSKTAIVGNAGGGESGYSVPGSYTEALNRARVRGLIDSLG